MIMSLCYIDVHSCGMSHASFGKGPLQYFLEKSFPVGFALADCINLPSVALLTVPFSILSVGCNRRIHFKPYRNHLLLSGVILANCLRVNSLID